MSKKSVSTSKPISPRSAFGIAVVICLFSVFLAAFIISVANDMYAFVKNDAETEFTADTPMNAWDFAYSLSDKGIIKNPYIFYMYSRLSAKADMIESFSGKITLNSNMSYREILQKISKSQ